MYNILYVMKKSIVLLPQTQRILTGLGENIRLARLRRHISMEMMANRAGVSRATIGAVEKGASTVSIGTYIQVLLILGLDKDLLQVAKDDILGRKLQDAKLPVKRRAPKS